MWPVRLGLTGEDLASTEIIYGLGGPESVVWHIHAMHLGEKEVEWTLGAPAALPTGLRMQHLAQHTI